MSGTPFHIAHPVLAAWLLRFLRLGLLGGAAGLLLGHLGRLHPAFDTMAVFRVHLLIGLAPLLVLSFPHRMPVLRSLAGLAAMLSVVTIAPYTHGAGEGPMDADWRLFQQNMRWDGQDPVKIAQYILDKKPEFVTLQEVSRRNYQVLQGLRKDYPSWQYCPIGYMRGVLAMSRFPPLEGGDKGCDSEIRMAWIGVQSKTGPVKLVAVYLPWAWPASGWKRLEKMAEDLSAPAMPQLISGDFNLVPWTARFRHLVQVSGTRWAGPMRFSFHWHRLQVLLPIDNVLIPLGMQARTELVKGLGSDHSGLWVRIGPEKDGAR